MYNNEWAKEKGQNHNSKVEGVDFFRRNSDGNFLLNKERRSPRLLKSYSIQDDSNPPTTQHQLIASQRCFNSLARPWHPPKENEKENIDTASTFPSNITYATQGSNTTLHTNAGRNNSRRYEQAEITVEQVAIHKDADNHPKGEDPSKYKYLGEIQGSSPIDKPLDTMYSISGSSPQNRKNVASKQIDGAVSGNLYANSFFSATEERNKIDKEIVPLLKCFKPQEYNSGANLNSSTTLLSGGNGHVDRDAPLLHNLSAKINKKNVRKKPNIPNNLCRRHSSEDLSKVRHKSLNHQLSERIPKEISFSPFHHVCFVNKSDQKQVSGRTTLNQILATLSIARFRLEELTSHIGNKKEESKKIIANKLSKKYSISKNDLEKLKRSTQLLKATKSTMDQQKSNQTPQIGSNRADHTKDRGRGILKRQAAVVRTYSSPSDPTGEMYERKSRRSIKNSQLFSRSGIPTIRDIPFRSASVSKVDLENGAKSSPNLRLYPACKDYGKTQTLPRLKFSKTPINQQISNFNEVNSPITFDNEKHTNNWVGGVSVVETTQKLPYTSSPLQINEDNVHEKSMPSPPTEDRALTDFKEKNPNTEDAQTKAFIENAKKTFLKEKLRDLVAASNLAAMEGKNLPTIDEKNALNQEKTNIFQQCNNILDSHGLDPSLPNFKVNYDKNLNLSQGGSSKDSGFDIFQFDTESKSPDDMSNFSVSKQDVDKLTSLVSIEDSENDSLEHTNYQRLLQNQLSDEGISPDESSSRFPEFSDSSSQDSSGASLERGRSRVCSSDPEIESKKQALQYLNKKLMDIREENIERSLTYPPLRKVRFETIKQQKSKFIEPFNFQNRGVNKEYVCPNLSDVNSQISSLFFKNKDQGVKLRRHRHIEETAKSNTNIRRNSDPGLQTDKVDSLVSYLSDSSIDLSSSERRFRPKVLKAKRETVSKSVISQDSTDSESRDITLSSQYSSQRQKLSSVETYSPQVILSDPENETFYHDPDTFDVYPTRYSYSRNTSPIPYYGDSDPGDRSAQRSPQAPRRYSKRPLRGPYGEMLEAEMSKPKNSFIYLSEDIYLRPRDSKSTSPRPSSPVSPAIKDDAQPLFSNTLSPTRPASVSSFNPQSGDKGKTGEDDETFLLKSPMHQRTVSSPSNLFFQAGCTSEEENEIVDYINKSRALSGTKCDPKPKPEILIRESTEKSKEDSRPPTDVRSHRRLRDTRMHIIGELYDTERNYVNNLNFLLTKYHFFLKRPENQCLIEPSLVDDIFFQVPQIHGHHIKNLDELKIRIDSKDLNLCVGDVILKMFRDPKVVESYTSFVSNWKTAQEATKLAAASRPAFKQFLMSMTKEHRGKRDLKGLLITPVQRFPHYELILKRLLEHTSGEHPDFSLLKEAIAEVQKIAASINAVEQEALRQEEQQLMLKEIENCIEGLVGLVQPDRTLIQLDQVTQQSMSARKERCLFLFSDILVIAAIKRRSATIRKTSSLQMPILSSLESSKMKLFKFVPLDDLEIGRSREDSSKKRDRELNALGEDLKTMQHILKIVKELQYKNEVLEVTVQECLSNLRKQHISRQSSDAFLCELELNIASQEGVETLTFLFNSPEKRCTWERNFNSTKQKLAMSADRRPPPEFLKAVPIRKTRSGLTTTCAANTVAVNHYNQKDVWVCNSDGFEGQVCVLSIYPEPNIVCCNIVCSSKIMSIASIPAANIEESSDDDDEEDISVDEDLQKRRSESLPPEICDIRDNQPTMWLGTEDGSIHIYNCSDAIRLSKNKYEFQPGSSVHCIIHVENRVFVALANGNIVVYSRGQGSWHDGDCAVIPLSSPADPVTKMIVAAGKLWCSCSSSGRIMVLDVNTLKIVHTFKVKSDEDKGIACMVSSGQGVWISLIGSAIVKLYYASTYEFICDTSVTPAVMKIIAGCDEIIRQHKAACLHITSLLPCKDLLWIGTSAGVIVTLPLPHLSLNVRRLQSPPNIVGNHHGHTGHVRFLTSVEVGLDTRNSLLSSPQRYSSKGKDHQPGTAAPQKFLVISGGDGYEDFMSATNPEMAGKNDSINHLLVWQV